MHTAHTTDGSVKDSKLNALIVQLTAVRKEMLAVQQTYKEKLHSFPATHASSARNLLHYLALRHHDLRDLQHDLSSLGLSSLGRTESHVMTGIDAVLKLLHRLNGQIWTPEPQLNSPVTLQEGEAALERNTELLLGHKPKDRSVRVMVTMPSEAAHDYMLVRDLIAGGMDCMRINCAHDGVTEWDSMIQHKKRASAELGRECRVLMDIAGPKLRTGSIEPGPFRIKLRPQRDDLGRITAPARVGIVPQRHRAPVNAIADALLHVKEAIPFMAKPGDRIEFEDARGRKRKMIVSANEGQVLIAEIEESAYLVPETVLHLRADHTHKLHLTGIPAKEQPIVLKPGDTLILTSASVPGKPAVYDQHQRLLFPAHIGVTLAKVFQDAQAGHKIWLDDGKIGGIVRSVESDQIKVEITHACPTGSKLRADKGVNLPDTVLGVQALTEKDIHDLAFIASHADMVGYSFVRSEQDVAMLQDELAKLDAQKLGIVLKIETRHAFESLPKLLLAAMKSERFGVMIARGDLAVECGYERTAEVQEEILWICEAAHTPVIWATQVLESLAKTGIPSRAEVTDAAMSERAECVMLNKGPFIRDALATLDDILRRMQAHQNKKRPMLRPLRLAHTMLPAS